MADITNIIAAGGNPMGYETTDDKHPDFPLVSTKRMKLAWGCKRYPAGVRAVWGARLVWPDQLVHDRQDLASSDDTTKSDLIAWLNGPGGGDGAIRKMQEALKTPYTLGLHPNGDEEVVIYEDEEGKIIGSAQSSHGYVYVAGWLKRHEVAA